MSYTEKRTLTQTLVMVLVGAAYCLTAFTRLSLESSLRQRAVLMLIFIGVTALASILIQVLYHVFFSVGIAAREAMRDHNVNEEAIGEALKGEFIEDERDKLVSLKSRQAACIASGVGFFAGLVSLLLDAPPALMLNIIYLSFFLGSLAEGLTYFLLNHRAVSYA